jgi:hypothetical protein
MSNGIKTKKVTDISDVQEALDIIPNINHGGCGIAALALARWIKKNKPYFKVHFILAYDNRKEFKNNTDVICNIEKTRAVAVAHAGVVIELNRGGAPCIVDSKGAFPITRYECTHTFADEAIMVKAINEGNNWNPEFNRANVYIIEQVLEIDLSDVSQTYPTDGYSQLITAMNETQFDPIEYIKNFWNLLIH